ncbi:PaaI family thioesterase [Thalassolituus sp. LLYu03]|uniref:PaaI family thioesterase n=1 Tax=Thalassolituus sp. LLYu03 TaxID=3421656 RepID=UPI003D2C7771
MTLSLKTRAERFVATLRHCQVLGLSVESMEGTTLVMRLPYSDKIVGNPMDGTVHGGSLTTLMDTACGTAVFSVLPGFELCPTLDLRMDYMKAAEPGIDLLAEARVIRIASSVVFTECEVFQGEGEARDLVAKCAAAFMRIGPEMTPAEFRARIEQDEPSAGDAV